MTGPHGASGGNGTSGNGARPPTPGAPGSPVAGGAPGSGGTPGAGGRPMGAGGPGGPRRGGGPFAGGPGMMMGTGEKSKNFGPSFRRLLGELRPEAWRIALVMAFAIVSVAFTVVGPKILGEATDIVFSGVISKQLPAGMSQQQVEAMLRASGRGQQADMISGMTLTPGMGIDFTALAHILIFLSVLYVVSSVFAWAQAYVMAGVTQRTVYRLRRRSR
jgi:ATP-binding cassette, subfamily B, multidrug efflux pump